MADRKDIGKKIRFEVFKRDKFTCQYCGIKAPDVILNVDHIHPVVDGGDNSIINLITSCFGCNSGKGARKIPDQSILALQREELEKQQERLEQIEMMAKWRAFLKENSNKEIESIINLVNEKINPFFLSDDDKKKIEKIVKKHGFNKVFEAADISADKYLKITSDNTKSLASIKTFIYKIEGILIYNSYPLIDQKIRHIKNIANKKYGYVDPEYTIGIMVKYVNLLKNNGFSEDQILNALHDEVLGNLTPAKHKVIWEAFMENRIRELQENKNSPPKIENTKPDDQIFTDAKNEIFHSDDFYKEIDNFVEVQKGFVEATSHILSLFRNSEDLDIESITKDMVIKICLFYLTEIKDGLVFDRSYKNEFLKTFYNVIDENRFHDHFLFNVHSWCTYHLEPAVKIILEAFSEFLFVFTHLLYSNRKTHNMILFDYYCDLIHKKNENV